MKTPIQNEKHLTELPHWQHPLHPSVFVPLVTYRRSITDVFLEQNGFVFLFRFRNFAWFFFGSNFISSEI